MGLLMGLVKKQKKNQMGKEKCGFLFFLGGWGVGCGGGVLEGRGKGRVGTKKGCWFFFMY